MKNLLLFSILCAMVIFSGSLVIAEGNTVFLENTVPGLKAVEAQVKSSFSEKGNPGTALQLYVNWAIQVSVVLGSILAVGVIILGGIKYMTTDSFSGKTEGREHLTNAIMGLIFLIGGYLIFEQVNPNILNISFSKTQVEIDFTAGSEGMNVEVDPEDFCGNNNMKEVGRFNDKAKCETRKKNLEAVGRRGLSPCLPGGDKWYLCEDEDKIVDEAQKCAKEAPGSVPSKSYPDKNDCNDAYMKEPRERRAYGCFPGRNKVQEHYCIYPSDSEKEEANGVKALRESYKAQGYKLMRILPNVDAFKENYEFNENNSNSKFDLLPVVLTDGTVEVWFKIK